MSAETQQLFKTLLKELRPLFKEQGFHPRSQNFILESEECWVIINFQKSRWSAPEETTFYVNVAASTKCWLGFYGRPADKIPPFDGCDWQWRAEQFGPDDEKVKQWTLTDEESLRNSVACLQSLFHQFVFPATATMTTEAGLIQHSGGFEYPQLKTRCVIFAATNQAGPLRETVATLIEKFGSLTGPQATRNHFEMLRQKYPGAMRSIEFPED